MFVIAACDAAEGLKRQDGECVPATGDFIIDIDQLVPSNLLLSRVSAEGQQCLVKEKCLESSEGLRTVIRFDIRIMNIGQGTGIPTRKDVPLSIYKCLRCIVLLFYI